MNGFIRFMIVTAMIASLVSCASQQVDDDLALEDSEAPSISSTEGESTQAEDDFSDFEEDSSAQQEQPAASEQAATEEQTTQEDELTLDDEAPAQEQAEAPAEQAPVEEDPFAESSVAEAPPAEAPSEPAPTEPTVTELPPAPVVQTPEPEPAPQVAEIPAVSATPVKITNVKYKANESGGTIIVDAEQPLSFSTRANPDLGQYIIEVENAILPDRLKRSLNTRDIKGSFGAIDAYQNPGSTTARFVIQLRPEVAEPVVQSEGRSLLIMASAPAPKEAAPPTEVLVGEGGDLADSKILASQNLSEFLSGNTKFYGKKISIETNNMDVRDALNFITEESGVNMVVAEEVKGSISLKLRQVPWDQALVVLMRAKKLGYTRQGNVLRIAPLADLKSEEDDATKLAAARKTVEPLTVRMIPVSYAKVDDLEKKIKDFLGERGKVVGDIRTNSIVVTDIQENVDRIVKLIASLDTQPAQVLIEGKIVEAKETFSRRVGVNWGATGLPIKLSNSSRGPVNMTPSLRASNVSTAGSNFNFDLTLGTLDVLGNLSAALALSETDELVKVISSPRIVTMTNEKADINQTTEVPVKTVTVNGTSTQETFQFKPLTLKLEVTPQVTADGSVIMKVLVNRQFQGANVTADGDAFSINSREANTKVLVKNGQTAVIGGIYQSDAQETDIGTPWFKDIPGLGYLFKSNLSKKDKSELLIFLTPRILGQLESSNTAQAQQ